MEIKMKNLIIIASVGQNNEIGINNNLIWKIKEDMKFFKETTIGHQIVMGRNTFESLPSLLPNRKHLVITSSNIDLPKEVEIFKNIEEFIDYSLSTNDNIFIIGGSTIYKQLINLSDKMILTEIQDTKLNADTYFPNINYAEWHQEIINTFPNENPKYIRKVYTRK